MQKEKWIADLTRCKPKSAISRERKEGSWIAVDYELEERRGVMIFGLPEQNPQPLILPLKVKGWHRIRIGIYYGDKAGIVDDRILCVKLSDDSAFSRIGREWFNPAKDGDYPEKSYTWSDITDVYWKSSDLTDRELVIAHPGKGSMAALQSNLAYVRLIPMSEEEISEWKSEQPGDDTKSLIANYDGGNFTQWGVSTLEDFKAEFECLRDSDFDIALYAAARGPITLYPSNVGELMSSTGGYGIGQWVNLCVEKGFNPLVEAGKAAHKAGVRLFPQNRFAGPQLPPSHLRPEYGGKFMMNHPEWMAVYSDGEPTRHLSFAYRGVRDFYVRMLREWVEDFRADGINLLFSRSYPFVYYEKPVCESFKREYGGDMLKLPVSDMRVQKARAGFMTEFLKEIRVMLDEVGGIQQRHIPACYLVPIHNTANGTPDVEISGIAECFFHGLDVTAWINEGLVDYLVVHLHMFFQHDGSTMQPKIREFTDLTRRSGTKVFIDVYPRRMPPDQYRKIAVNYYNAGADGLAFWDSYNRYCRASEWAFVKRLGHRDDLSRWSGKGDDYFRVFPLKRLDGFLMDREFSLPTDG